MQVTWKNPNNGAEGEANHIAASKDVAMKAAFIRDDENIEFSATTHPLPLPPIKMLARPSLCGQSMKTVMPFRLH